MGEGEPNSLGPCIGFTFLGEEVPPSQSARGRHARRGGSCYAPWAKSGASQATLPDYMSSCQMAAFSDASSVAADNGESEWCAFKVIFLRIATSSDAVLICVNHILEGLENEPPKTSALPRNFRRP